MGGNRPASGVITLLGCFLLLPMSGCLPRSKSIDSMSIRESFQIVVEKHGEQSVFTGNVDLAGHFRINDGSNLFEYLKYCIPTTSVDNGYVTFLGQDEILDWNRDVATAEALVEVEMVTIGHDAGPSLYVWDSRFDRILEIAVSLVEEGRGIYVYGDFVPVTRENVYYYSINVWQDFPAFMFWLDAKYRS